MAAALLALLAWSRITPPRDALVARVIDGDTIRLWDGRLVRYIGIDTPEMRRRVDHTWIEDPQPLAQEATDANRRLVGGRVVRLEFDVEPRDRFGRLLAYVYVDGVMVNERLAADGYARVLTIKPDVKYAERFRLAVAEAKQAKRGLWRGTVTTNER